ncbi:DNA-methyltransferase [Lactiplantibacillus xiangfangensis]|uniref:DNA-methyltransferase n=1 Tax=Lactiplantibacillus xiangfangensis TaxID=942150 RepID=UPI00384A9906
MVCVKLQKGNCLDLMKSVADQSVDMICCDLPYGTTANAWDEVIPFAPLWKQYSRVIKDHGAIVLFSQLPFGSKLIESAPRDLPFRHEWIWEKSRATGFLNAHRVPLRAHENILVFYKHLPTYNPQFTTGKPYRSVKQGAMTSNYHQTRGHKVVSQSDGRRYPRDVIKFASPNSKSYHPTQKPVRLLDYLIKTYTNPGDLVLDNCMGSGSTGVSAIETGRSFIGMEMNDKYFEIAQQRINEAQH